VKSGWASSPENSLTAFVAGKEVRWLPATETSVGMGRPGKAGPLLARSTLGYARDRKGLPMKKDSIAVK